MKQDGFATLQRERLAQQILHRQALEHHCGGLLEADCIRQFHQLLGRQHMQLAIRAQRSGGIGHAVAHLKTADRSTHRLDDARTFGAQAGRQRWRRIQAAAEIGVDKIQADRLVLHPYLIRTWGCGCVVGVVENVRAAVTVELDTHGHFQILPRLNAWMMPARAETCRYPIVCIDRRQLRPWGGRCYADRPFFPAATCRLALPAFKVPP